MPRIQTLKLSVIKGFMTLFTLIPLQYSQLLGTLIGRILLKLNKKRAHIVRCNIRVCFPEKNAEEQEQLVKAIAEETGKWMMESAHVWFGREEKLIKLLEVKNPEYLQAAYEKKQGVVVVLPHLGNWEMINFHIPQHYPSASMYKPLASTTMETIVLQSRQQAGAEMFGADTSGVRRAFKHLKKGKVLVILSDHLPTREAGVYAPFFGQPALTGKLTHTLLQFNPSEAVLATILRKPNGEGFELEYHPIEGMHTKDPVEAACHLNAAIEKGIRLAPEQYQWVYSRFSRPPEGTRNIYR